MENPRRKAYKVLLAINGGKAFSNEEVQKSLNEQSMTEKDARLFTALVYGVLQNQMALDLMISRGINRPMKKLDAEALVILRIALFQIYYLDRVPAYAAVNEAVKTAQKFKPALRGFVNGVLRGLLHQETTPEKEIEKLSDSDEKFALNHSVPHWITEKYLQVYSKEQVEILFSRLNRVPPLTLRTNTLKTSPDGLMADLMAQGFEISKGTVAEEALYVEDIPEELLITDTESYRQGHFTIQDEGAMLAGHWLAPQKGECILDMCAAPGGKTTHLAQAMANTGTIVARDLYDHRLEFIRSTAQRMGFTNIQIQQVDGRLHNPSEFELYDKVLLDAPCSGLGVIGRKPEIRYRTDPNAISELLPLQAALLENAFKVLKPGGFLLYSTCTVNPAENEEQIVKIMEKHPELAMVELPPYLDNHYYCPKERGSDCFYLCKLQKKDRGH
ncbi:MAG: 16S rRNA (cytosine(967)-C(5))-methyltransferase RsmB [Eubacteriaceae bacterium]|jgi:16S rRNA (cytosine967-C5)-methyltransferase|nr:16S rRNA (cytosine(967)-C(5))-methyltransferase RsmB [Eubacteriaceae bacterium]